MSTELGNRTCCNSTRRDNVGPNGSQPKVFPYGDLPRAFIYKPHGSLGLLERREGSKGNPVFLLDDDQIIENKRAKGSLAYLPPTETTKTLAVGGSTPAEYAPLVIPPSQNKSRTGQFLFEVNKNIDSELAGLQEVLVIIGWSMPDTDWPMRRRMETAFYDKRHDKSMLKLRINCDVKQPDLLYDPFRATIPSAGEKIFKEGFGKKFVDEVLISLWQCRDMRDVFGRWNITAKI